MVDMSNFDLESFIMRKATDTTQLKNLYLERLLKKIVDETPRIHLWRIHIVDYAGMTDRWPGVASWLGDFPPGHPDHMKGLI